MVFDEKEKTNAGEMIAEDEGEVLHWKCHPVKRRPLVSLAVTLFITLIGVLVLYATGSHFFTALALVILFASLAKFYFPTEYFLSDKNLKVKTTTQTLVKPWSMYRTCYPDRNGILLSPFGRPSRLENFRGLYIMFEGNRDEVTAFIKKRVGLPETVKDISGENDPENRGRNGKVER
ncbi:MAG: hypothetical protein ACOYVF_05445 [Candidatus Zixiibacteriota bacterium]